MEKKEEPHNDSKKAAQTRQTERKEVMMRPKVGERPNLEERARNGVNKRETKEESGIPIIRGRRSDAL